MKDYEAIFQNMSRRLIESNRKYEQHCAEMDARRAAFEERHWPRQTSPFQEPRPAYFWLGSDGETT